MHRRADRTMCTDAIGYQRDLDKAPKLDVSEHQFRTKAALAGWLPKTIELFLSPPLINEHVLVGKEGLRLTR